MSVWGISGFCWGLVSFFIFGSLQAYPSVGSVVTQLFVFDSLSFFLTLLVFLLGVCAIFFNSSELSVETRIYLVVSLGFSVLCFLINHSMLFWCFYELSMLPLLYLIFRDSPYSERFLAGWYFSGYLLLTSLPLLLVLIYLSYINGSCLLLSWHYSTSESWLLGALAFIFFTKVPLCPFHTWLPIVHAEATSVVSTFLSGYIMKLGIVGVFRFCGTSINGEFFFYLALCCLMGIGFLVVASSELDGKRWLALLSLAHILVPFIGLFVCGWSSESLIFLFSLGHGLGAGLVFGLLWQYYSITNTRNWVLLKSGVGGTSALGLMSLSLLSLCSFPPTVQFFSEVFILSMSSHVLFLLGFWICYLFLGGIVPLVLCGHVLLRVEAYENDTSISFRFGAYLLLYIIWCYFLIIVF
uniref:NADH-ubiquinone oxidoreductase chain 4 n=1 Tax=Khawia sinensis TaxID=125900 RepID=A0A1W5J057_9CEST|nr:NADH dehydrogenase subunit 4 [Khawia sinensis]ALK26531.1 NADH dehydrogenase subunit 4 [Khawia sinensis]